MNKQGPVSLIDISTYLPGEPIGADYYAQFADSDDLRDNLMFRAPKFRHHVAEDETAIDMVERATAGLIERHGQDVIANVDVLITHTQAPDLPFYGGGGGMAHRLGMKPNWVLDLHNGGCAAFVLALNVARQLLASGAGRPRLSPSRKMPQDRCSISREFGARRRRRSPAMGPRWAWSPCPTSRPFSISSAVPTANTPVR